MRGECVRQRTERKSAVLRSPQSHTTTRANISHEKAEQIRARKPARPLKVQGGRESSTRADESKDFCQPSPVGEGGARSVTDEVLPCVYCQKTYFAMFAHRRVPNLNAPVSATPTHTLRVCVNSPQEKANKNHCPPICARRILRAAEFT